MTRIRSLIHSVLAFVRRLHWHPSVAECSRSEYRRRHYASNHDHIRAVDNASRDRRRQEGREPSYPQNTEYKRAWQKEHPERDRAYRESHTEQIAEYQRAYYRANRERILTGLRAARQQSKGLEAA